ncbi:MAG TPA: alkaline phosphatase D family protein [Burkholderiales bacterium]
MNAPTEINLAPEAGAASGDAALALAMQGFRLRLPAAGPLIGWCRAGDSKDETAQDRAPGMRARIFAQPDDSGTDEPLCLLIAYQRPTGGRVFHYLEPITTRALLSGESTRLLRFFADDVHVPLEDFDAGRVALEAYAVHLPARNGEAPLDGLTGGLVLDSPQYAREEAPALRLGVVAAPGASSDAPNWPAASSLETDDKKPGSPAVRALRALLEHDPGLFEARRSDLGAELARARTLLYAPAPPTRSFQLRQSRDLTEAQVQLKRRWAEPLAAGGTLRLFATTCRYPGFAVEQRRSEDVTAKMLAALEKEGEAADALLMLGDQIYADATGGLFDCSSPLEKYGGRYQALFASPRFRRLATRLPVYMTQDDHEFTNNWCQEDMFQGPAGDAHYRTALGMLHACQIAHSPYGARAVAPPFDYHMRIRGVPVYMMDTITMRHLPPGDIVDAAQLASLERWLRHLEPGEPKLICTGSVVAPGYTRGLDASGRHDPLRCGDFANWQGYAEQRRRLFDMIRQYGGGNVLLVSGDYHCAAQATITHGGERVAEAVIVPPLYAPMRYINDSVRELAGLEIFGGYEIKCPPASRITGSGYAVISLTHGGATGWKVACDFAADLVADP